MGAQAKLFNRLFWLIDTGKIINFKNFHFLTKIGIFEKVGA